MHLSIGVKVDYILRVRLYNVSETAIYILGLAISSVIRISFK
jgi:hypothetical protein